MTLMQQSDWGRSGRQRLTPADRVIGTSGDRVIGKAKTLPLMDADDTDATVRLGQAGRQRLTADYTDARGSTPGLNGVSPLDSGLNGQGYPGRSCSTDDRRWHPMDGG